MIIICMALATVLLTFPGFQPQHNLAMGSKGSVVQPEGAKKDGKQIDKDREGEKSGEGISPKESDSQKKEKAPPEKKPRIKYREEPGCQC
jgi:hypothetical protein